MISLPPKTVLLAVGATVMAGVVLSRGQGERDRAAEAEARVRPRLRTALEEKGLRYGDPVFLRIFKEERELEMWIQEPGQATFRHFRTYPIAGMSGTLGPKLKEGDRQAPEGFYFVPPGRMNPRSKFHLSFNLGYPNSYDQAHGRTGSFLMVHGGRWSVGCFAMTNPGIEEIYTLCDAAHRQGQAYLRVHAFPFRMTAQRLEQASGHQWEAFWNNLKTGYDAFRHSRIPPSITVREGLYAVE